MKRDDETGQHGSDRLKSGGARLMLSDHYRPTLKVSIGSAVRLGCEWAYL